MRHIAQQLLAWEEATVKSQSEVTRDAKKRQTGTLCNTDGLMSSQKLGFGEDIIPKMQRTGCAQSTTMFLRSKVLLRQIYDSSEGVRHDFKTARMLRRSERRYECNSTG